MEWDPIPTLVLPPLILLINQHSTTTLENQGGNSVAVSFNIEIIFISIPVSLLN